MKIMKPELVASTLNASLLPICCKNKQTKSLLVLMNKNVLNFLHLSFRESSLFFLLNSQTKLLKKAKAKVGLF